jgi:hypothetical protein
LESEEFVKPVAGSKCPILYTKAKGSPQLDALVVERRVRDSVRTCVGYAVTSESSGPKSSGLSRLEDARVHANGSVSFNVEKIGDLHELLVREDGRERRIKLFGKEPSIPEDKGRGAVCWNGYLYFQGQKVRIQFWQGKERSTFRIWPEERRVPPNLLPGEDELERYMESRAQDVANFIAKHGGWRFGLPSFNGQVEIASQDERILSQIPDDIRRVEGVPDAWIDESEGKYKREFETTSTRKARAVFEFDKTAEKVDGHTKRIYVLESDFDHIVALLEKMAKASKLEADINASIIAQTALETVEKIERKAAAANGNGAHESEPSPSSHPEDPPKPLPDKYEVMYR